MLSLHHNRTQSTTESFNRLGADSLLDSSTNGMRPFGSSQELTFNYFLVTVFNLPLTPLTDESSAMALSWYQGTKCILHNYLLGAIHLPYAK